jgi:membrane protein implicated in regulation of membrane protease activity
VESVLAAVVAVAIILAILLVIGFDVFCLVLLSTSGRAPFLPKWIWALAIVCLSPVGGLAYVTCRRARRRARGNSGSMLDMANV